MKKLYYIAFCLIGLSVTSCGLLKSGAPKDAASLARAVEPDADTQRRYDYFYLEAIRQKTLKNYTASFELLQHCLAIHPQAASAHYELAQYYLVLKQPERGLQMLELAVRYEPTNYWYCQGLAHLYMQMKQPERASALLEQMVRRFPDKLDPLYTLVEVYTRREAYAEAVRVLDVLEERAGKSEQISMEKFNLYRRMDDTKRAFSEIESLVAEYPSDCRYRVVLGDALMQAKRYDEAYAQYRGVLADEPDNALAMYSLAQYYEATDQPQLQQRQLDSLLLSTKVEPPVRLSVMRQLIVQSEQAGADSTRIIRLFDRIMHQEPDEPDMPMLYAQYLFSKGMDKQAMPVLKTVLDIDPTNTAARLTLLGEAVKVDDYDEIRRLCEGGVASNPDKLEFYFYLAISHNRDNRTDQTIEVCREAVKHVTPESRKELVSDFYTIMGDCYHTKRMNTEAYAAYDSALVYHPNNIGALNNYAYYLSLERRQLDKAEEMSYKTVKAEPNNATYLDTYAWILFEKGKYTEARIYIDEAMKHSDDLSGVVVEHCGDIYFMTGDVERALKFWKQALEQGNTSETLKEKIKRKKYIREKTKNE